MTNFLKLTTTVFIIGIALGSLNTLKAQELIIGDEIVEPGIHFIFEGAIKDDITPSEQHLPENQTDVHLEARVNWTLNEDVEVPKGTPRGGFVPYLKISGQVVNNRTDEVVRVDLLPHINLVDNFHYARNIALPGEITDTYSVSFFVIPLANYDLALHKDWREEHGNQLFTPEVFEYDNVDFEEIARATRN